ncbi:MAG: AAA family ATPase [Oscillospiraceae bacterium]|nr:AAA family ATPase [Oscillospiraceae bacterium]
MKLNRMRACFGALQNQELELKDGLNIIEAPNEGGKSTWAAFLRAMLYGIDTRERDKKGVIAEKNRFQPWSGNLMEGCIDLIWQGRDITLRRSSRANAPFSRFQAVYTGTEDPVPDLTAETAGELLTGVGRAAFERSAFIGQDAMAVTDTGELEQRISALVSTGQEEVSYSETERQLREWKNYRQSNQRNGIIPRLEEERAACQRTLDQLEQGRHRREGLLLQADELKKECAELEGQAKAAQAKVAQQQRQRLEAAQAELEQAQAALEAVRQERRRRGPAPSQEELRKIQGELSYFNTLEANIKQARLEQEQNPVPEEIIDHPVFASMEPAAARAAAQKHASQVAGVKAARLAPPAIALGCAALLLIFLTLLGPVPTVGGLGTALICAIGCGYLAVLQTRQNKAKKRAGEILDQYGAASGEEILQQAEEYAARWEAVAQARTEAAVRGVTLERLVAEREELKQRLLSAVKPFAPEVRDLYGVSAAVSLALKLEKDEQNAQSRLDSAQRVWQALSAQSTPEGEGALTGSGVLEGRLIQKKEELGRCRQELARIQGEMSALGDPAALEAQVRGLEEQLARRRREHQALELALSELERANTQLRQRLSPVLNARAGELFGRLTGGAYSQVSLNRQFEAWATRPEDVTARRLLELSKGTADQLYLAVRLALCELVLPGDDPPPLILDDALVRFDDHRLALALNLLEELAGQRQILLFTCQGRERLALQGRQNVNLLCLG